jgi:hypothetical protein
MPRTITSLEGYTRKIRAVVPALDEVLLYRGHANRRDFKLLPSVLRSANLREAEHAILRELIASHPMEFAGDTTTLGQLARAQHYSLPTRLLDITWNPLVGFYFAVNELDGTTGEVIVFRVKKTHVKYYDSDTVSCVANLAHLKLAERNTIDFALPPDTFNVSPVVDRLLQFIRVEKPFFRNVIKPDDLKSVLCVKPKKNSQRILVQAGAFLLFGIAGALDTTPAVGITVERIAVNGNKKAELRKELDRMDINQRTLFPEIEKAALYIRGSV